MRARRLLVFAHTRKWIITGVAQPLATETGSTADWALMMPDLNPIRCDPRFAAVVQRVKTKDPYAAKVCAGKN